MRAGFGRSPTTIGGAAGGTRRKRTRKGRHKASQQREKQGEFSGQSGCNQVQPSAPAGQEPKCLPAPSAPRPSARLWPPGPGGPAQPNPMFARAWRRTTALTAAWAGGASLAHAHQAQAGHAWRTGWAVWRALAGAAPVALAAGLPVAALAIPLVLRKRGAPPEAGGRLRRRRGWTAGAVLALTLWTLPWLSLHSTHHALEKGEVSCPVAQAAAHQGAGVLPPAAAALDPPLAAGTVALRDPAALTTRAAPRPAARSPPV